MTETPETPTAVTITLTLEDVAGCWNSGMAAAPFRDASQYGRFECSDPTLDFKVRERASVADGLIAAPAFETGTLLWCDGYAEALLLAKVHRALGHTSYLLWDMADSDTDPGAAMGHVVLTSWPLR